MTTHEKGASSTVGEGLSPLCCCPAPWENHNPGECTEPCPECTHSMADHHVTGVSGRYECYPDTDAACPCGWPKPRDQSVHANGDSSAVEP